MISNYTQQQLADLIYAIADGEVKAEVVRQVLAEKSIFEPFTAFKRIARDSKLVITELDLKEFLVSNNVKIGLTEAQQIIRIYDLNEDGKLSFTEFLNAILPKDDLLLRQVANMRPTYEIEIDEKLPYDLEYAISRVFEEEFKNLNKVQTIRKEVVQRDDFSLLKAFELLDHSSKHFLTVEDFCLFMEEAGRKFDENDRSALFRRIDLDFDGKVSYSEFVETVFGIEHYSSKTRLSPVKDDLKKDAKRHSPKKSIADTQDSDNVTSRLSTRLNAPRDADEEYKKYIDTFHGAGSPRKKSLDGEDQYRTPKKTRRTDILYKDELVTDPARLLSSKKKSPLKGREEEEFIEILKAIIDNDKFLRSLKDELALRPDFNLFDSFRYFDVHGKGSFINSKQFEEGCNRLNIFPTKDEVFLFFRKNDTDYDGLLRFDDICSLLYPKNKEYIKMLINREPEYVEKDEDSRIFSPETERLFTKAVRTIIDNEIQIEAFRQKLARRPLFNLYDAFRTLDKSEQNAITIEDLKLLFGEHRMAVSLDDLESLVDRFKGNKTGAAKISYAQFITELTPKSTKMY